MDEQRREDYDSAMSTDLGLDPSDPLNLLIHNSSSPMNDSYSSPSSPSSRGASPPEWSQLSALWSSNPFTDNTSASGLKYPDLGIDFALPMPLDMDFNPSLSVDPCALHFDSRSPYAHAPFSIPTTEMSFSSSLSQELLAAGFPFTFPADAPPTPLPPFAVDTKPHRRLSITSSSSSGASFSPITEHSIPVSLAIDSSRSSVSGDPAEELAERVRQAAGVMLAVPGGVPGPQTAHSSPEEAKMPVPRPPRHSKAPVRNSKRSPTKPSCPSSTSSSPGPETPVMATLASTTSVIGRPKTSHTTIERRYRKNLNARIQSLKSAVPALRVLEEKGAKGTAGWGDAVDDRGYVDGVKVARKVSKANVLGKAVEYIRVLKKREARLKREQNGLKSLLCGLVGGPALLKEWEREWKENFGGEERDEVEGEEAMPEPLSDGEEEDEADEEEDEEEGRSRKRAKLAGRGAEGRKASEKDKRVTKKPMVGEMQVQMHTSGPIVPEKRKRGRPRKVQQSSMEMSDTSASSPPSDGSVQMQMQGQPQQYLLATFALFSFFNSPLTSYPSPSASHSHSGSVLGHTHASVVVTDSHIYGWRDLVQAFHMFVSALVLLSIVVPWLPRGAQWKRTRVGVLLSSAFAHTPTQASDKARNESVAVWLQSWSRAGMDKRTRVRMGEQVAMAHTASLATRIHAYWCMSSCACTPAELATLALVVRPLSGSRAKKLWTRARASEGVRKWEKAVLEGMNVDEAAARLVALESNGTEEANDVPPPIAVLAEMMLGERMRKHAAVLFLRAVSPDLEEESAEREDKDRETTIEAAESLGGDVAELAESLEGAWKCAVEDLVPANDADAEVKPGIKALLTALVLYRRVFPHRTSSSGAAGVLSPPPSPSSGEAKARLALRTVLGAAVFECKGTDGAGWEWGVLEDARDRVVDMLFEGNRTVKKAY